MSAQGVTCRVFEVQRFCVHDGPGIRTTVFLAGCPLRCAHCHNPEGQDRAAARALTPEEVLGEVLEDQAFYAVSGGGLTLSGGEPLFDPAAARALLALAKAHGLHTCVQTSGHVGEAALESVLGLVDLFQLDLKHMDSARHCALTGAGNERVLAAAELLLARGAKVEFRMPLLPGVNDDEENLGRVAAFLAARGAPALRLLPYHRLYLGKAEALGRRAALADLRPPTAAELERAAQRLWARQVAVGVDA